MHASWEIVTSNALLAIALAAAVALVGRLWKNPAALHLLWMFVLLKLITPPLVSVPVPLSVSHVDLAAEEQETLIMDVPDESVPQGAKGKAIVDSGARKVRPVLHADVASVQEPGASTVRSVVQRGSLPRLIILAGLWIAGTAAFACGYGCRVLRFLKLLRAGGPPSCAVRNMADRLSKRLGLRRVPEIVMLPVRVSPLVWFVGRRPRVVLPAALFERLDVSAQETILAHELAHLRRNDHWVRLLELLVNTCFWWHPVVWWARRQLQQLEEQCCDGRVLRTRAYDARTYATALLDTLDFLSESSVAVPAGAAAAWPSVY